VRLLCRASTDIEHGKAFILCRASIDIAHGKAFVCRVFYLLHGKGACAVKFLQIVKLLFFTMFAKIAHGKDLCRAFVGNIHGKYLCRTNI
jgi:hypothetical protein